MKILFGILIFIFFPVDAEGQQRRRDVALEGAVNFRDMGEYSTTDYRSTVRGKVYRAGDISKLTDADMEELKRRKIYTVIDFRSEADAAAAPDRLLPGANYISLPAGSVSAADIASLIEKHNSGMDAMVALYSDVSHFRDKYRQFFRQLILLPDTSALLFHCSTGKDRAGIAAALFLYTLDIPIETIISDYLASNHFRLNENQKNIDCMVNEHGIDRKMAAELMDANPRYLESMFQALRRQHGSIDSFLSKELGINEIVKYRLREKFLQ